MPVARLGGERGLMADALAGPVHAVTFDLDNTLWDLAGVIELAEQRTDEWLSRHYPDVASRHDASTLRQLRSAIAERQPELGHDVTALRREGLRAAGRECGYAGTALEALVEGAFEAFIQGRHEVRLYDETIPLLDWLGCYVPLGAITNGNADVRRLSLSGHFDFTVSAMEIGASKPSHLVFEAAAGRAEVARGSIVHVGDNCECDVVGAAQAGMQAVWIPYAGEDWPEDLHMPEHARVRSLSELTRILAPHLPSQARRRQS